MDNPAVDERERVHFAIPRGGIQVSDLLTMVSDYPYDAVVSLSYAPDRLSFEGLGVVVDQDSRTISGPKGHAEVTELEFNIIAFLAERADVVQTRENIFGGAWPKESECSDFHIVDTHLSYARPKLKRAGIPRDVIHTVRGVGFMFRSYLVPVISADED